MPSRPHGCCDGTVSPALKDYVDPSFCELSALRICQLRMVEEFVCGDLLYLAQGRKLAHIFMSFPSIQADVDIANYVP